MTIAMLSWKAEKTLDNTLKSYAYHRLDRYDDERLILLQEGTPEQEAMARYYGFEPITVPHNLGIALGYQVLLNAAQGKYFLFLENDWELIEWPEAQLRFAHTLLDTEGVDVVRLRHRKNPGSPLWSKQFEGNEASRPEYLLDSVYWNEYPHIKFSEIRFKAYEYFQFPNMTLTNEDDDLPITQQQARFYITSSQYANWTNNPHLARTDFLRQNIAPRLGTRDLEKDIQDWWQKQDFKVAQGDGLFTHTRLD